MQLFNSEVRIHEQDGTYRRYNLLHVRRALVTPSTCQRPQVTQTPQHPSDPECSPPRVYDAPHCRRLASARELHDAIHRTVRRVPTSTFVARLHC